MIFNLSARSQASAWERVVDPRCARVTTPYNNGHEWSRIKYEETSMKIKIDDLHGSEIAALLSEHLRDMYLISPPESVHALDLNKLRQPNITFWTLWDNNHLAGCGALKELDAEHAEVKSMRTSASFRRKGVAAKVLQHIINEAERRGYKRLSLETGSMDYFKPACNLYERFGFEYCEPFADYSEDPYSLFMTREI